MAGNHQTLVRVRRGGKQVARKRCVAPRTCAERIACLLKIFGLDRMRECGASREALHRYSEGVPPPLRLIEGLADGLGVSTEWLVMGRGPMLERDRREGLLSTAQLNELFPELLRRAGASEKRGGSVRRRGKRAA